MGQDGVWHITPTYDFTFSVDPSAPGYVNRHCMTINNKNSAFERGDLLEVAKKYNIKGADSLIEKAIGVVSDYQRYAHIAGVDGYWSHQIKEEINDRIEMLSEMSRQNGFHWWNIPLEGFFTTLPKYWDKVVKIEEKYLTFPFPSYACLKNIWYIITN